jgi:TPR repeat protein
VDVARSDIFLKQAKPTKTSSPTRSSIQAALPNDDAKKSVHGLVPYLDHPSRPSFAAAIRAIRDHEPRIAGEDKGTAAKRDERYQRAARRAVTRYEKAADQGFVMAQYNLARALAEGRGAARDAEKAVENFRKAALQGNVPAMLRLAEMHLAGLGGPKNQVEAQALYYVAAGIGSKGAMRAKTMLGAHLDNAQLEKVRKRARILRSQMPKLDLAQQQGKERQLLASAARGDLDGILEAIEAGMDANAVDDRGRTAAIVAAWRGHARILRSLIDAGVEIDAADKQGRTALSWAAINGYPGIAKMLLKEEALVDAPDSAGLTPLIRAAWNGHEEIVAALINSRADVNVTDDDGFSALRRAEAQNEEQIAARLRAAGAR